jgi:hypothetical protein
MPLPFISLHCRICVFSQLSGDTYFQILFVLGAGMAQWGGTGLRTGLSAVRIPTMTGNFSLHHRVLSGSGAPSSSCATGAGSSFLGGGASRPWCWPLASIWWRVRVVVDLYFPSQYAFMSWCSVKAHRQLYVYIYILFINFRKLLLI